MILSIDGVHVISAIEIAAWVGSLVAMLVIGLIVYLMVRPPRRPPPRADAAESEELVRLMKVMERRLDLLERAVADQRRDGEELLEAGVERPETRRLR